MIILDIKHSCIIGMLFVFSILAVNLAASISNAQASNGYDLASYEWGIEAGDVLSYSFQLSIDKWDVIRESGFRDPLVVIVQVESVPPGPKYINGTQYSLSANMSIIECRIGNLRFTPALFSEKFALVDDLSQFFAQARLSHLGNALAVPINILDYWTSLYRSGTRKKTFIVMDRSLEESFAYIVETSVEYSGTYFRHAYCIRYMTEKDYSHPLEYSIEYSRLNGIVKEIHWNYFIEIDRDDYTQGFSIIPGTYARKESVKLLKIEKQGYPHMGTPGFSFFIGIVAFCLSPMLLKRRHHSKAIKRKFSD
jgi:hypothetical protein